MTLAIVGSLVVLTVLAWMVVRPWYHLNRAMLAYSHHQTDLVQYHIDKCLQGWPNDYRANLIAARLCRRQQDLIQADKHLHICYQTAGMTEELEIEWLLLRAIQGDFPQLEQTIHSLARSVSDDAFKSNLLECLAICYLKELRAGPLQPVVETWVKLDPGNPRAYYWRAMLREKFDELEGAFEDFSKALELAPYAHTIRLKVANMLMEKKEFALAKEHIDRLHRDQPDDLDTLIMRGRWYFHQGQLEEARPYLQKVLAKDPKNVSATYGLGQIALESGDLAEAEGWLRRTLKIDPDFALARYSLYLCLSPDPARKKEAQKEVARYREQLKDAETLKQLVKKVDARAQDVPVLLQAAEKFFQKGNQFVATQYLSRALRIQPDNPQARALLEKYPVKTDPTMRVKI